MAGTDKTAMAITGGPAIILVEPQLGENIGAVARAMYNFGLTDLRLVAPRDGWPNEAAIKMASGALPVIEAARIFPTTGQAVADLGWIGATTARMRELSKPVLDAEGAARAIAPLIAGGGSAGLLFGRERTGLENDDIARADAIITFPVNPTFASLNLGQAVLLAAYEWFKISTAADWKPRDLPDPAPQIDLDRLFEHLFTELDAAGFLKPADKAPGMMRNIRTMLMRATFSDQDVRTMRGIIRALAEKPRRPR